MTIGTIGPASATSALASSIATSTEIEAHPRSVTGSLAVSSSPRVTGSNGVSLTAADVQSSVSGINASIQNVDQVVWSRFGITPQQIAEAQNFEYGRLQSAEGATIARAGQFGVQGVSFDFKPVTVVPEAIIVQTTKNSSGGSFTTTVSPSDAEPSLVLASATVQSVSRQLLENSSTFAPISSAGSGSAASSEANILLLTYSHHRASNLRIRQILPQRQLKALAFTRSVRIKKFGNGTACPVCDNWQTVCHSKAVCTPHNVWHSARFFVDDYRLDPEIEPSPRDVH